MKFQGLLAAGGWLLAGLVLLLLATAAFLFLVILINSPGRPRPVVDAQGAVIPGSIAEKIMIPVTDGELGCVIKSADPAAPVLLYLHGGIPDYFLTQKYPTGLERIFTVAWLDQRGSGLSYGASRSGAVDLELMIRDVAEVSEYLRSRFGKEKIFLMGRSGGTFLGVRTVERYPELFAAYFGVGQIVRQKESEKRACDYILAAYADRPDRRKVYEALRQDPVRMEEPLPATWLRRRDYAMHDLGIGTMREMRNVGAGLLLPSLLFREYTATEKLNLWCGKVRSGVSSIWNEVIAIDLTAELPRFEVPVYLFHGRYDYTCNYDLAREYYNLIEAPDKEFYTFEESAHSSLFEEAPKLVAILSEEILPRLE